MKKYDIVTFHSPLPDEDPNMRYLLLDDPEARREHKAELMKIYKNEPPTVTVKIEYHGKYVDGKFKREDGFFSRGIMTVKLDDLKVDEDFKGSMPDMDAKFQGKIVVVKAPADKGGKYIGRDGTFSATLKKARRFNYTLDNVGEQVGQLIKSDMAVEVEEVDDDPKDLAKWQQARA